MNKVVVITGPTGIGKTEISLGLCGKFNGEIINADASQLKKDLNIGTAKIDLKTTTIKHHLIDVINADEVFSISDYQKVARELIEKINKNNKLPFLVGGSGLYINSTLYNYELDTPKRDEELENKYSSLTNEELHNVLKEVDFETSLKIHYNNRCRVLRAIELARTGKAISDNQNGNEKYYNSLIICLDTDRDILYDRINKRVIKMINDGWIEECKDLIQKGYKIQNIKDIGYQEIFSYLNGDISYEEMIEIISKKTRNYAKRQLTWMRNKMNCIFVKVNYNDIYSTYDKVVKLIIEYLSNK